MANKETNKQDKKTNLPPYKQRSRKKDWQKNRELNKTTILFILQAEIIGKKFRHTVCPRSSGPFK